MNYPQKFSGTFYPGAAAASLVVPQNHYHSKSLPFFFIMMRFNIKLILSCFCIMVLLISFSLWNRCGNMSKDWGRRFHYELNDKTVDSQPSEDIECIINGDYTIRCRKEGNEVYMPFSFLKKYFEVYGKVSTYEGLERFEWSHSYSKIYNPKGKYDPRGVFMHFENYNVEVRDRVKCVSAMEGVPVSTQWESQGYYYPTQIAQFGLSHYSKNLTEPEPRRKVVEDSDTMLAKWIVPQGSSVTRTYQSQLGNKILNFTTFNYSSGVTLKMDHVLDFVMNLNILLHPNSSLNVVVQNREKRETFNLFYVASDILITAQDNNIYHGVGLSETWQKLTRDLIIDLQKGLNYYDKDKSRHKLSRPKFKITNIILRGHGAIDNLSLSSSEHISQFYDAADWFVKNQDMNTGGWPIPVKRKLAPGFQALEAGWYSSMGQGQALSVLSRAYYHSGGELKYLEAALAGLKPFRVPSAKGGVLATFLNKYSWYEEYPTRPASFVLNGFIYSLLGLYDLMTIAPQSMSKEAEDLFEDGMVSLKNMLMFYDMGSGTSYDLRHYSLGIAPNLARWDYHATHVNQLLLLKTIDSDVLFQQTAERWKGYMTGRRAAHN